MSKMLQIQKFRYTWASTHGPHSFSPSRGSWREDGNSQIIDDHLEVGTADGEAEVVSIGFGSQDAHVRVTARDVSLDAWAEFVHFVEECDRTIRQHIPEQVSLRVDLRAEGDANPVDEDQAS